MRAASFIVFAWIVVLPSEAFLRPHQFLRSTYLRAPKQIALIRRFIVPKYGPNAFIGSNNVNKAGNVDSKSPSGDTVVDMEQEEWEQADAARVARQKVDFRNLIHDVINTSNPEHLPSLLTKQMDLLLTMRGYEGANLIEDALKEAKAKGEDQQVSDAIEFILSFAEAFVDHAHTLDDGNKELLGKIIRTISNKGSPREREELLDTLLEAEKENFTTGFLKHVDGECERIAAAPVMTRDSSRLLEILRIIQARVLEELGKVRTPLHCLARFKTIRTLLLLKPVPPLSCRISEREL